METGKIKNFILMVLILTNLFLLGIFAVDKNTEREVERSAYAQLRTVYEQAGISLPEGLEIMQKAPAGVGLRRDLAAEKEMAEAVLGSCTVTEEGGNIYSYTGEKGYGQFRGNGDFNMLLNYGVVDGSRGKIKAARGLLEDMGIECGSYAQEEVDGKQTRVVLDCAYEGSEVYNARVEFLFSGDTLMIVNGSRVFDTKDHSSSAQTIDALTALIRFLNESVEKGQVYSSISSVSVGYTMSLDMSENCTLSPVWYIETDTGSHILNAASGKMESVNY